MKQIATLCFFLMVLGTLAANDTADKVFEGEISDSQCGFNIHSLKRSHDEMIKTGYMGKTPEQCAKNCVRGRGGQFVFVATDKKNAYKIVPQATVAGYAGQKVRIEGRLTNGTISVTTIKSL
jgi:hypothetical protein